MIQSMTSFARTTDYYNDLSLVWEIRTVNHRYFDCSFKLPETFRILEIDLRHDLQKKLWRGKIECFLKISQNIDDHSNSNSILDLNKDVLINLANTIEELQQYIPNIMVDPLKVLSWPCVSKTVEPNLETLQPIIRNLFTKTLESILVERNREGSIIVTLIREKLQTILTITTQINQLIPIVIKEQRTKLEKQLNEISISFDHTRLEQELVYFYQKIDINEEIDRLVTHTKEALRIVEDGELIGKKLDFLMQELNRETNTIASKSSNIEIIQFTMELKVLIEQIREQAQNLA